MYCEDCGGPLDCFEGEWYCPPCAYFGRRRLAAEADDEARRERRAPAPADDGPPDGECPRFSPGARGHGRPPFTPNGA